MIRKTMIVVLTLGVLCTGLLWGASYIIADEVFVHSSDTGIAWGNTFPNEGLFCAVTDGQLIFIPVASWDYERQEWTRGSFWNLVAIQVVLDPRGGDNVRGVSLPIFFLFFLFAVYPSIAYIRCLLHRRRQRRKGLCLKCGYNLTGNTSGTCPECGSEIKV